MFNLKVLHIIGERLVVEIRDGDIHLGTLWVHSGQWVELCKLLCNEQPAAKPETLGTGPGRFEIRDIGNGCCQLLDGATQLATVFGTQEQFDALAVTLSNGVTDTRAALQKLLQDLHCNTVEDAMELFTTGAAARDSLVKSNQVLREKLAACQKEADALSMKIANAKFQLT